MGIICIALIMVMSGIVYFISEDNKRLVDKSNSILYENAISENGINVIESRVVKGKMPELYVNDKRVTKNEMGIEYTPRINDKGHYAYSYFHDSNAKSAVMLNKRTIFEEGLCKILELTNSHLVFSSLDLEQNISSLYQYNLKKKKLTKIFSIEGMYFVESDALSGNEFLIQIRGGEKTEFLLVDLDAGIEKIDIGQGYNVLEAYADTDRGGYSVVTVTGNNNGKYLANALYDYYKYQYGEPFSASNDFAGRISWNESQRLNGLIELWRKTKGREIESDINDAIDNILSVRNKYLEINTNEAPEYLWSTKKYSLDKQTPRSDLVDNGQILYPLLKAANDNIVSQDTKKEIINIAEQAYEYFDNVYKDEGHYIWEKGSCFYLDGIEVPWNQQNSYALSLIELYKLTENEKYYERVKELMTTFKEEWRVQNDGEIMWHYWPTSFYDGWTERDNKSTNTPERDKMKDDVMEDISHGAINAKFVLEYYNTFQDNIITESDIIGIRKMMSRFCSKEGFNTNISGLGKAGEKSFLPLPGLWWVEFGNEELNNYFSYAGNCAYPDFDSSMIYCYAFLYDPNKDINLTIEKSNYSKGGVLLSSSKDEISNSNALYPYIEEVLKNR